ncbi:response regulator [Bradyrhizobium sp. BR 1432]|uniref:response regulator n=1 Tax=Bradyrhizobium sp. BR 1432 TaxID=3447966 RepID=UPI003EE49BB9
MAHKLDVVSVVCDDGSVQEPLLNLLISAGCVPELFQSADEFLSSKGYISTSCLIADMELPTASGHELYEQLIAFGKVIPTILLVAAPDDDSRVGAMQAGVSHFLRKPLNNSELLACIKSTLKPNDASRAPVNMGMPASRSRGAGTG